ncbi:M56 family metallopeptidase [Emticicia sp. 21SJ11W-3]|uniref:M56 family metallopeptidase n=1 Tax=Emticicia sp. 21SJ11W-3 TaxID=2916755 RepID=UPI00209D489C|nr:M56 family metallopeptidase [Emticicia sp. 21SJ11W-3]UTA68028.1 hypothetical protein MB380_20890 [Emticicia sp. 21SJ11W-3]
MILYLFKSTMCLAILWGIYKLLLEAEKIHRFNRFYLLASLVFAIIAPLVNIEIAPSAESKIAAISRTLDARPSILNTIKPVQEISAQQDTSWTKYAILLSCLISALLLTRFIYNLFCIYKKVQKNESISYQGATLILLEENILPYTFLNFIFLSKVHYVNANIEPELLSHELAHVRQKHSFDVLVVEILRAVCWFNPMLYLFKQAIQLNHEFLADEAVNSLHNNITSYQYLLLSKATQATGKSLTSNLNFQITKKRFLMMTKITSAATAFIKKAICAPLFIALAICLANIQLTAQKPANLKLSPPPIEISLKPYLLTKDDVNYQNATILILQKKKFPLRKKPSELTEEEKKMPMKVLYFEKEVPTTAQMKKWEDSKMYGVWLNNKRIANSQLSKYKASDIANYFTSKLAKNAINYGKHYYQINLMTNDYYENVYLKEVKESPMLIIDLPVKKEGN